MKIKSILFILTLLAYNSFSQKSTEQWRPAIHFSPKINWTNDPNGLIYIHLFFQHNPKGNEWGNMSWGHAKSKDLLHWEELPLAIPHGKEYIFSGCVVYDKDHVSGLGDLKKSLLIAIYTADYPNTLQEQHLAFSNDEGVTWTKYEQNPVLSIQLKDFRDPNIIWHEPSHQFVMSVVKPLEFTVQFYGSKDLLHWNYLSEFGHQGDVDMIWECPSLLELPVEGSKETKWVFAVSSQGPYKKSVGMQYFVGDFDGKTFTNDAPKEQVNYVDYGRDFYAAIPFYNTVNKESFWLGWMLSWSYAKEQPTFPYKGQMSLARTLSLVRTSQGLRLKQVLKPDLTKAKPDYEAHNLVLKGSKDLSGMKFLQNKTYLIELKVASSSAKQWGIELGDGAKENPELTRIGFDEKSQDWFIDRRLSGQIPAPGFDMIQSAPFIPGGDKVMQLVVDRSTLELLAQDGTVAISSLRFPTKKESVRLVSLSGELRIKELRIWEIK
ncbi:MAG: Fructan beta-fructosidase [Bacteroidota bacterium]